MAVDYHKKRKEKNVGIWAPAGHFRGGPCVHVDEASVAVETL